MFKDVFVIKKKSWHSRMMKYIWGFSHKNFSHMCPYFWLSLANCFLILIVFPIKGGGKLLWYIGILLYKSMDAVFSPIYNSIMRWIEEGNRKREEAYQARKREADAKEEAIWKERAEYFKAHPEELVRIEREEESVYMKIFDSLRKWHWDDWSEINESVFKLKTKALDSMWAEEADKKIRDAKAFLARKKEQFLSFYTGDDTEALLKDGSFVDVLRNWEATKKQREIEAEAARIRANKARINAILKITKPITTLFAYVLGSLAVLVGVYYLWKFVYWCYEGFASVKQTTYNRIGNDSLFVLKWLLIAAVIVGVIFLLIKGVAKLALIIHLKFPKKKHKYQSFFEIEEEKLAKYNRKVERLDKMENIIAKILFPFVRIWQVLVFLWKNIILKIFKAIKNAVLLVIQMIRNNCPAIRWED